MSVLLFLAVLFVLILVHELGHFMVAKWSGMKVEEFGIGFPPKLWGIKKGETEYTLNLLPIGGFVKITGENAEDISDPRSFVNKNRLLQTAVLVAGVTMNVLFAWVLFIAIGMIGSPAVVEEGAAGPEAKLLITEILPDSPAAEAGIPAGVTIVSLTAGDEFVAELKPSTFSAFVSGHAGEPMTLTYQSGGENKSVVLESNTGVLEGESDRPAIGIALSLVENVKKSFLTSVVDATKITGNALVAITVGVSSLLFGVFTFSADLSQVAGPVGIVGLVDEAASFGLVALLSFTAFISLNLAVINLLPIPALDGGRLLFVVIEAIIHRPINPIWMARVNYFGFAFLILLMVAVTFSDVAKII